MERMGIGNKKIQFLNVKLIHILCVLFIFILSSCIEAPKSTRKVNSSLNNTNTNSNSNIPKFEDGKNFFQNGGTLYYSTISIPIALNDALHLRGKDVDNYIRSNPSLTSICMAVPFSTTTLNKVNIITLLPRSVYNYTNQTLEYYFSLSVNDQNSNANFCQRPNVVNALNSSYPTLSQIFQMKDLCPSSSCLSSQYVSGNILLLSTSGATITQIATTGMQFSIINNGQSNTGNNTLTCVSNEECKNLALDCCVNNICAKDLSKKSGINESSIEYQQALQDILNNPSKIYDYPQFYNICSKAVTLPKDPPSTTIPVNEAQKRLDKLKSLYTCTTKINGEYGVCLKTYTEAELNTAYSSGTDDRSFSTTFSNTSVQTSTLVAIEKITYGEVTIFDYTTAALADLSNNVYMNSYLTINGIHNDDYSTGATVTITNAPPGAVSKELKIYYKNDASCSLVNSTLAKCEKYYVQGQENFGSTQSDNRMGRVTDHYPGSNDFLLPSYANTGKNIRVELDGIQLKNQTDWVLVTGATSYIKMNSTLGLRAADSQIVKIIFFADINPLANHAMKSKEAALNEIKTLCGCSDLNCSLRPIINPANDSVTDYKCIYPDPIPPTPPLTQKIFLSSKTVPVRFFDNTGASQSTVNADTLSQEGENEFKYINNDYSKPNNETGYIGFHEIYGSIKYSANSPKPAKEVNVKAGNTYDLFVDRGSIYSCSQCGNDYYSNLNKLFPGSFNGGGLVPMQYQSSRFSTNSNLIPYDDFKFGRACFIPATMIPWSHSIASDPQIQRLNRMRAQHFLFSNGYKNDWFGFDYGSVIGSFDGVKWFSIGANRRIKATSNKLFLAINAYMGDLTLENTYEVLVNDAVLNPAGTSMVNSDFESDGAECQRYHQCNTDLDCSGSLGYDYVCANINEITTSWPVFDENGKEIPDAMREDKRLSYILGSGNYGKRCVYRGKGALCTQNYRSSNINLSSTFNETQTQSFHTCSANNYCQTFQTGATYNSKFNNRVSRFAKPFTGTGAETFGLGVKVPMRPYDFNGSETIRPESLQSMSANKAASMCISGRSPEASSFVGQNSTAPSSSDYPGDKVIGIGTSQNLPLDATTMSNTFLSNCSVVDPSTKNYYYTGITDPSTNNSTNTNLVYDSATQAISTNSLKLLKAAFTSKGMNFNMLQSNSAGGLTSFTFQENACLRPPGATCNSDLECAPNKQIADRVKILDSMSSSLTGIINTYELKFWQEELICSQAASKTSTEYFPQNNRCCREVGKKITVPVPNAIGNQLDGDTVPGISVSISSPFRYSRWATIYKDLKTDSTNYPELSGAIKDQCSLPGGCINISTLTKQYKTLSLLGEKTSCSGNWIRLFYDGKHNWSASKFQAFKSENFKCFNWFAGPSNSTDGQWSCAGLEDGDPLCTVVQTSPTSGKGKAILEYLGKFELMGIPQIAIESENFFNGTTEEFFSCKSNPTNQSSSYPGHPIAPGVNYTYPPIFASAATKEYTNGTTELYSAVDNGNFTDMKNIFKADEFISCLPTNSEVALSTDAEKCCSGYVNPNTMRCALPDWVDISVYTNKYVSNEASTLSASLFDDNGYIKDPSNVATLACAKNMCKSKKIAYGLLISKLKIPGQEGGQSKIYRFLEGRPETDNLNLVLDLYKQGLKLNNHAYCIPENTTTDKDVQVITCN